MPTLRQAVDTYLKIDRAQLTNKQYAIILGRMSQAIGPARRVERIAFEDLLDWLSDQAIQRTTRRNYTSIIKAFFNWCVSVDYIEVSPARRLKREKRNPENKQPRAIPPEELRKIVDYARMTSPRNYALLLFMADTGCRVSGACSLTIDNLHIDEGYAWLWEKGGRWERAIFGPDTATALSQWLSKRPPAAHAYVWTGQAPDYRPLTANAVRYVLKSLSTKTGCSREWFPHSIRHALAFAWADAGVPPTVVARKLWHGDPAVTLENYYPMSDERVIATSQRLALQALRTPDHERFAPVPLPAAAPPVEAKKDERSG